MLYSKIKPEGKLLSLLLTAANSITPVNTIFSSSLIKRYPLGIFIVCLNKIVKLNIFNSGVLLFYINRCYSRTNNNQGTHKLYVRVLALLVKKTKIQHRVFLYLHQIKINYEKNLVHICLHYF